jgi:predicted SnoaL-like aldol condensation-catalyzing enzyme
MIIIRDWFLPTLKEDKAMDRTLESNKQTAVAFLKTAFVDKDPEKAIRLYVGDYYRQHNPVVPDGKEGVLTYAKRRAAENPNRKMNIKRVIGEGEYVVIHIHHVFAETDKVYPEVPNGMVSVDIFRFENGKIVEHWDVLQPVPAEAVHNNTMF